MTNEIFRDDAYAQSGQATVVSIQGFGIELDQTIFYPLGGGQPGDTGILRTEDGREVLITDTRNDRLSGRHFHIPAEQSPALYVGETVFMEIDWGRRYRFMRMHTLLHLICSVLNAEITGCQISDKKGRIDLNLKELKPDKEILQASLEKLVMNDLPTKTQWISEETLKANPSLVKNMSVKPPLGKSKLRLVEIEGVDLQPCGGTHVACTSEIGRLSVGKIENKGRNNRRINLYLED